MQIRVVAVSRELLTPPTPASGEDTAFNQSQAASRQRALLRHLLLTAAEGLPPLGSILPSWTHGQASHAASPPLLRYTSEVPLVARQTQRISPKLPPQPPSSGPSGGGLGSLVLSVVKEILGPEADADFDTPLMAAGERERTN